jgi:hypothetical protein
MFHQLQICFPKSPLLNITDLLNLPELWLELTVFEIVLETSVTPLKQVVTLISRNHGIR